MKRMSLRQNKLLSFGGRYVLITSVLQSMPIYLLSDMCPPVSIVNQLHKIFYKLFCANTSRSRNKHWISWDNVLS